LHPGQMVSLHSTFLGPSGTFDEIFTSSKSKLIFWIGLKNEIHWNKTVDFRRDFNKEIDSNL
jgi:hypothetical protein